MSSMLTKKDFDELKSILEHSAVYMSKYFKDLKIEVDVSLADYKKVAKDDEHRKEIESKRVEIIKKICDFEILCSKSQLIDFSKEKLDEQDDMNEVIRKTLFLNRTLIFLDKKKCKNKFLFDRLNSVKLVIIINEHLSAAKMESLKQK